MKDLGKTSGALRDESLLTYIYEIQKVVWEAKLFQSFYFYRRYAQTVSVHCDVFAFEDKI